MDIRETGASRPTKPGFARRAVVAAVTTAMATVGVVGSAAPVQAITPTEVVVTTSALSMAPDTYEKRVQKLINGRRAAKGLRSLRLVYCADRTAERWSRHLASTNTFYHQSMVNVINSCDATYAGETLGRGTMSPRKLVRMWMNSPGHRAILLTPKARRIGIGATPDASGRWVVAANFVRL